MVKPSRPVIILTPQIQGRANLVTVAALSTGPSSPVMPFHYQIPKNSMPLRKTRSCHCRAGGSPVVHIYRLSRLGAMLAPWALSAEDELIPPTRE